MAYQKKFLFKMNTGDTDISPQESLQVIRSMIETTKNAIGDKSHFFLLWGWATLVGCLLQYFLLAMMHYPRHYYAWLVTPIALLLHIVFIYRDKKRQRVKTFISEANKYVWAIIGYAYLALLFVFARIGWQYCFPFYILLYGIGTYISGSLLQFKPMRIGGAVCLFLVVLAPYFAFTTQMLLSAFAILISYIIPGHLLRLQYKRNQLLIYG